MCYGSSATLQLVQLLQTLMSSFDILKGCQFPDKAIDLMDEACSIARMQTDNEVKGNSMQHTPVNTAKGSIVSPEQVAQVG
jgi:ATP-dependent Clp protease ATP-binding subunit ClpA